MNSIASVNPSGRDFPWPLRLAACMLLFEITSFLRDSYRRLPRSTRVSLRSNDAASKTGGGNNTGGSLNVASGSSFNEQTRGGNPSSGGAPTGAIVVSSGESFTHHSTGGIGGSGSIALATNSIATPASNPAGGRRWSMALSSMGQSQNSAQSLQSITGDGHSIGGVPGERKISFVLHEPDDESLDSSNTTLTFQVCHLKKMFLPFLVCFTRPKCSRHISREMMRWKRNVTDDWLKGGRTYFDEVP